MTFGSQSPFATSTIIGGDADANAGSIRGLWDSANEIPPSMLTTLSNLVLLCPSGEGSIGVFYTYTPEN